MNEIEAIRELIHSYCDRVCNNDQTGWLELWTKDAVWDIGRGPVEGRDALQKAMSNSMELFEAVNQMTFNGTATTTGDTGEGRWYICEFAKAKSGKALFYLGHYDDTYEKSSEGWKFSSRRLTWLYQGPPDLSGAFGPPPGYNT
ncbi:MAG TPA: hypothetical protein DCX77_06775 [Acidimicrobiaceae bacterium]|nr:hypothetical protein [Acidimicrobiaceae bacterium]